MKNKPLRIILLFCGSISLALGIIGIFLPLLPTTPFLLLTAYCYAKGSDKFYKKLIKNKWLFSYINDYKEGKGIKTKIKIITILFLWFSILLSIFYLTNPAIIVKVIFIIIALLVTIHILLIKKRQNKETD